MWLFIKYNHKKAQSECAHTVPIISGILHRAAAAVRWPFLKTGMTRKGVPRSPKESKGVPRSLRESQGVLRSPKEFQGVLRSSENSLCVHYVNEATYFSTAQGVPRSPTEFTETLHGYITQIRQPVNPV